MGLSFISGNLDSKPIKDLLLEYKADVVEEELVDEEAEVRIVRTGRTFDEDTVAKKCNLLINVPRFRFHAVEPNRVHTIFQCGYLPTTI